MVNAGESHSGWLNAFDVHIELYLNHFAHRSAWLDSTVTWINCSMILRGGVIAFLVWYVLFDRKRPGQLRKRAELLAGTILLSLASPLIARGLAHLLPFRARPIAVQGLPFLPFANPSEPLMKWSAFPSDHAALFFMLATGIFFVSWRVGLLACLWVAAMICLPRLYLGLHWPTDILAGAALGAGLACLTLLPPLRRWLENATRSCYSRQPGLFFAGLFLYSFQVATIFEDMRRVMTLTLRYFNG